MEFWILMLLAFFVTNALDKAESVQLEELEELPLQTFDELFVDEWLDKDEAAEELITPAPTNFGQNVHHQIDRQNTQIGQIEPNSTDQNPLLTEYDHSENSKNDKTAAKELGLSFKTIYAWKRELGQTKPQHKHPHSEQKELMKRYYAIKVKNSKISDWDIAKMLNIGSATLFRWKKQFKRQQLHPNAADGHSVEENAAANVQEIENSNAGIPSLTPVLPVPSPTQFPASSVPHSSPASSVPHSSPASSVPLLQSGQFRPPLRSGTAFQDRLDHPDLRRYPAHLGLKVDKRKWAARAGGRTGRPWSGQPGSTGFKGICPKYCAIDGGIFFEDGTRLISRDHR
uniref:Uncharacterized protein n=1 Tax=Globodera rostochiensis TaxID=31243 RepID=A0A914H0J0_GLORO